MFSWVTVVVLLTLRVSSECPHGSQVECLTQTCRGLAPLSEDIFRKCCEECEQKCTNETNTKTHSGFGDVRQLHEATHRRLQEVEATDSRGQCLTSRVVTNAERIEECCKGGESNCPDGAVKVGQECMCYLGFVGELTYVVDANLHGEWTGSCKGASLGALKTMDRSEFQCINETCSGRTGNCAGIDDTTRILCNNLSSGKDERGPTIDCANKKNVSENYYKASSSYQNNPGDSAYSVCLMMDGVDDNGGSHFRVESFRDRGPLGDAIEFWFGKKLVVDSMEILGIGWGGSVSHFNTEMYLDYYDEEGGKWHQAGGFTNQNYSNWFTLGNDNPEAVQDASHSWRIRIPVDANASGSDVTHLSEMRNVKVRVLNLG